MNRQLLTTAVLVAMAWACASATAREPSQGDRLMGSHRYADAEQAYRQELEALSGAAAAQVQHQIALTLHRRYQCEAAIAEYQKVLGHEHADESLKAATLLAIGQNLAQLRRYEEALDYYAQADAAPGAPADTRAHARLFAAYTLNKMGDKDAAIDKLASVIEVAVANKVTHQQALLSAGKLRQEERRYAEAREWYAKALALGSEGTIASFVKNGLIECDTALTAEPEFFFAPYVSLVSATEATIFWVSLEGVPAGKVVLCDKDGQTIEAQSTPVKIADRDAYRQTVALTGLKPYTLYRYDASSGGKSAAGYFHTARDQPGPTRFVVMGDTQTGWEFHARIAPLIAAEDPDFVLHVGDCVDEGPSWDQWKLQMFDPGKPYLSKAPIWVARGNHDGGPYFPIVFGREKHPWISFTFGDLHVMVLESTFSMGVTSGAKQLAWLEQELGSLTTTWSLIGMHHCLFHTATGDLLVGQDNFRPLVERASPDLVFNGHYHKYSRQVPTGLPGHKPVINVVTGGAGGGNGTPSTRSPLVAASYESFHYCLVEIDGDRLDMTAKDIEGNAIDRMTLIKKDGKFQDQVMAKAVDPATFKAVRLIYDELKFPNYARTDLTGQFTPASSADGKARVTLDRNVLDPAKLPADTMLIVAVGPETRWAVPEQTLNLSKGELTFEATPPADAPNAPLSVRINVRLGERLFEPHTMTVTLRQAPAAAMGQ